MLETQVNGVQVLAMCSSLPIGKKESLNNASIYYQCLEEQCTSDLGYYASRRLFEKFVINKEEFGVLLFGSRTADYRSPNTAAVLQTRLEFSTDCICYDINVGANGFIQLIQIGAAILNCQNKQYALLIVGDTPSKLRDQEVQNNFELSDAATAIILQKTNDNYQLLFNNISFGSNYDDLILREGGFRDFSSTVRFDATKIENFIVKQNLAGIKGKIANYLDSFNLGNYLNQKILYHHLIAEWSGNNDNCKVRKSILADASELPIELADLVISQQLVSDNIIFFSAGEGLSLYGMYINHIPICLATEQTVEVFLNYRVNHDM